MILHLTSFLLILILVSGCKIKLKPRDLHFSHHIKKSNNIAHACLTGFQSGTHCKNGANQRITFNVKHNKSYIVILVVKFQYYFAFSKLQ